MKRPILSARRLALAALVLAGLGLSASAVTAAVHRGRQRRHADEVVQRYAALFAPAGDEGGTSSSAPTSTSVPTITSAPGGPGGARGAGPRAKGSDPHEKLRQELVQRITQRNVFSPPRPPKKGFAGKLVGVLGQMAYFEGNPAGQAVGQNFNGATIKTIGPDWVEVEAQGKLTKLFVFDGGGPSGGPPSRPGDGPPPGMMMGRPGRLSPGMLGGPPGAMPPEAAEAMARMRGMSQAERAAFVAARMAEAQAHAAEHRSASAPSP